jgi:hypothetical protein
MLFPTKVPAPMVRATIRLVILLFALAASACSSFGRQEAPGTDEADRRQPEPRAASTRIIDADAPLDVRLLRIEPGLHVGSERVCNVLVAGQPQEVTSRSAQRYPEPIASRRLIRCGAATGEGWADLVFPVPSAALVGAVNDGTRLRVKVLAAEGGFEGLPVFEFLAVLGTFEADSIRYEDFLSLPAGFDFTDVEADDLGDERRCVVAYAGLPLPLAEPAQARLPGRPTHRISVVCKHGLGDAWVELVFSADQATSVLALRRGARADFRVVASRAGRGELPVVSLVAIEPEEA